MRILFLTKNQPGRVIFEAVTVLKNSGIVAFPTESYYALGVMAKDEGALKRLYDIKKRPLQKAMPLIVGNKDILGGIVNSIPEESEVLMEKYWPGPLTMVFEAKKGLSQLLTAGLGKIAAREPGEGFALSLARAAGFPVTATSANISSMPPAKHPDEVIKYFGDRIDLIVDAGETPGGKPSTIVDVTVTPPKLLREGRVRYP